MRALVLICALALALDARVATAMEFRTQRTEGSGSVLIIATGEIFPGDDEKLHGVLGSMPAGTEPSGITLSSPGGDLAEALLLATTIRNRELMTAVTGQGCASACFLLFAAGTVRYVYDDAKVGAPGASPLPIASRSAELGVSAEILDKMARTPPSRVAWLTRADLESMGVLLRTTRTPNAPAPAQSASQQKPAFEAGRAARVEYEKWRASLEGEFKQGAEWWAAHRSTAAKDKLSCATEPHSATWVLGCIGAEKMLKPIDVRRLSEPEFRAGWNSL